MPFLTPSVVHATARLCVASVAQAVEHLSTAPGMAQWNLGLWNCREVEPGLFTGESLFDGATGFARVQVDADRGLIDYRVGTSPAGLKPRIRASVVAGEMLEHPPGTSVVTLETWRTAGMSDERWTSLMQVHETEIALIQAQLGALPARQYISGGSPWEEIAGYSRAVADGDWIFVSGTVGQDFTTMTLVESAGDQAEQALDTIERALAQTGATPMDVVRVRVVVPDRNDVAAVSAAVKRRFGAARPANTTVCCALAVEGAKVEIDVTARRRATGSQSG